MARFPIFAKIILQATCLLSLVIVACSHLTTGGYSEVVLSTRPTNKHTAALAGRRHSRTRVEINGNSLQLVYLHASAQTPRIQVANSGHAGGGTSDTNVSLACEHSATYCPGFSACKGRMVTATGAPSGNAGHAVNFKLPGIETCVSPASATTAGEGYDALIKKSTVAGDVSVCPDDVSAMTAFRVIPSHCAASMKHFEVASHLKIREYLSLPHGQESQVAAGGAEEEGWEGRMFLLRNVFVDRWGRVFNETHLFHAGRCSDTTAEVSWCTNCHAAPRARPHVARIPCFLHPLLLYPYIHSRNAASIPLSCLSFCSLQLTLSPSSSFPPLLLLYPVSPSTFSCSFPPRPPFRRLTAC